MNDATIGRSMRVLRRRANLRQADVAARAGVSQQLVSKVERGRCASLRTATLRRLFAAVDADLVCYVKWRGGELDRLLDEGHAALVGRIVAGLRRWGWQAIAEVTFAAGGERGSIDVLAWHAPTRTLLVIEVKTEITSIEEMLRRHDVKVRLAPRIARERFAASPVSVVRILVIGDTQANRNRVARSRAVLDGGYPAQPDAMRRWLRDPTPGISGGVLFVGAPGARQRLGSRSRVTTPRSGLTRRGRPRQCTTIAPGGAGRA